ncbi:excisionase [Roseateles terrae]|uniref:Excisionase n=1 Tax=Roseateles terrae TaxID=431060 RepID=A0ABR6GPH7_9BURK|nr:excisionase [Roseateles terrae]MBB3193987.1 hypothetical protein [Roseateles terrae]OWQ87863.1 excisionase [Roseateles terrae]
MAESENSGGFRFVTIRKAAELTGLSAGAIEKRIARGIWARGKHYRKADDGRIWIDMKEVEKWVLEGV